MVLLVVLFPIACYLAFLGWINRRPRGLLISGPWDFAGILFAASGMLLFGGPALLSSLCMTEPWRHFWLLGKGSGAGTMDERLALGRVLLFGSYFVLILAASGLIIWSRRRLTTIYNVHPALVERVLGNVIASRQLPFVQMGNVLVIDPEQVPAPSVLEDGTTVAGPLPPILVEGVTTLQIEASARLAHVSLWWTPSRSLLRQEVEMHLRRALAREDAPPSVVGDWLILLSSLLFFLLLLGAGGLTLLRFLHG